MKNILLVFVSVLFISCNNQNESLSSTEIRSEVYTMMKSLVSDLNTDGIQSQLKYLDNSDKFQYTFLNSGKIYDYEELKKQLEISSSTDYKVNLSFDEFKITPLSDKLVSYSLILSGYERIDGQNSDISLVETGTLIRRNDGWKIINAQTTVTYPKIK